MQTGNVILMDMGQQYHVYIRQVCLTINNAQGGIDHHGFFLPFNDQGISLWIFTIFTAK